MEKRAKTQDELSVLTNQAFADLLLDYRLSSDGAIYSVASIMFSGSDPEASSIKTAIKELKEISSSLQDYRKIEAINLSKELSSRYPEQNTMNELTAWVKSHCKFAAPQQRRLLSPQELDPVFQEIAMRLKGITRQDPDPAANFNAVKSQVTLALQKALSERSATIQDVGGSVDEIMRMMGVQQPATQPEIGMKQPQKQSPAPMQQGQKGEWEDPGMAQFRQNRQK
jgi:hypothetical protein